MNFTYKDEEWVAEFSFKWECRDPDSPFEAILEECWKEEDDKRRFTRRDAKALKLPVESWELSAAESDELFEKAYSERYLEDEDQYRDR